MPKITSIKVNKKKSHRLSIYLDGKFAFSVTEGIFLKRELREGQNLSPNDIEKIKGIDDVNKAKLSALNFLSFRSRSEKEVLNKLIKKGWSTNIANSVIDDLLKENYLNDNDFATTFSHFMVKNNFLGPKALRQELLKKGISEEIIQKTMIIIYQEFPTKSLIRHLLEKRGLDRKNRITIKEKNRVINQLRRKGFDWDDINPLIRNL